MRVLLVAAAVAFVCSVVVSAAVYVLRPMQQAYEQIERNRAIVAVALDVPDTATELEVVSAFVGLEAMTVSDALVYLARNEVGVERWVVPFSGRGMWSTIDGFVALDADLEAIAALAIERHGETAGIGDRIEDPEWLDAWRGKRLHDAEGRLAITVVAGADAAYEVDLITGASITCEAVGTIVREAVAAVLPALRAKRGG